MIITPFISGRPAIFTLMLQLPLTVVRYVHYHDMQERWNLLMEKDQMTEQQKVKYSNEEGFGDIIFLDKSLDSAIDSFDNLFCRRCLVREFNL